MIKKLLLVYLIIIISGPVLFAGNGYRGLNKHESYMVPDESNPWVNPNKTYVSIPLVLEGVKQSQQGDYWFGPEIPMAGLSGYYDYQTNGDNKHMINRYSPTVLHAIMMLSTDSALQNDTRRTKYSFSDDDGATWNDFGTVPSIRSGFCSLVSIQSGASSGAAVIANHFQPGTFLAGHVNYDISPGGGSFTAVMVPFNFIWPGVANLSNNNILVCGETYQSGAATDTGAVCVFNTTSNSMQNYTRLLSAASSHTNMRWTYAAGPNGNAIYVMDAISDVGGNFGLNRIFIFKTTNNGTSWDAGNVLYNPSVIGTDTLVPFFGLDAIYDAAGNYYVAFNTTSPAGTFASAKLWVQKNGGTPVMVAQHDGTNGIPEAAETPVHADAGIVTLDHPSLSLSADGNTIFVAFSVQFQDDILNGFNKCHIYYSFSPTGTMAFNPPIQVTNGGPSSFDERYPSIYKTTPDLGGSQGKTLFLAYQKDPQPGSCAFNDAAPISRSNMIFRKIHQADSPIGIVGIGTEVPGTFSLHQNYPNPFNPTTKIRFDVPKASNVTIKVYNTVGQLIGTLVANEFVSAGVKEVTFNGSGLASGVYYYTMEAGDFKDTKKLVLVK